MTSLAIGVFLWSLATGLREGYTWTGGNFPFMNDYHAWRMVEQLGILMMIYGAGGASLAWMYLGFNWLFVYTIYEPALNYMITGRLVFFDNNNLYTIFGVKFNQGTVYQLLFTIISLVIIIGVHYYG